MADEVTLRPSPVSKILSTNEIPDDSEYEAIRTVVSHTQTDLRLLDSEIAQVQTVLDGLRTKRAAIQQFADAHAVQIRRVPVEILANIFMLCLPTHPGSDPKQAPLLLGQVCRSWRKISLSTPLLWSRIRIGKVGNEGERSGALRMWLERSGDCPLSLHYRATKVYEDDALVWDAVIGCPDRWEHLDILCTDSTIRKLFPTSGRSEGLPHLKSLRLHRCPDFGEPFQHFTDIIDLASAPRFSRVNVISIQASYIRLPFAQMTKCDVEFEEMNDCIALIHMLPRLVECEFRSVSTASDSINYPAPFRHEQLEKLKVTYDEKRFNDALGVFLEPLTLPALCDFEWFPTHPPEGHDVGAWPGDILLSFLARSQCTLSRFWILSGPSSDDILRYLEEIPSVVDLSVGPLPASAKPDKLMQGLTLGGRHEPEKDDLVPHLEHLLILGCWGSCEEMQNAIESRFDATGVSEERRLKKISLHYGLLRDHKLGEMEQRLIQCVNEGLKFEEWPPGECC